MVICKYFLRGTCRFGENCKNEHAYNVPDNSGSVMRKKQDIDPNIILKSVSNDMDKAEQGHQWPFTCYGPFQGKPCFPGFEDKSFEEVRLEMLEAEKNGTINQYKQQLMQLLNETKMKMRSLQNPTPEATNLLKDLFNSAQETPTNIFATASTSILGPPPIYGSQQPNIYQNQPPANNFSFTQNKSVFNNTPTTNSSMFTNTNPPGNSIFGGGNNSMFTQNNFPQPSNIFQNANQNFTNTGNIFGSQYPQNTGSIFNNSPFTQNVDQSNPFKQNTVTPTDPFQQNTVTATDPFQQNTVTNTDLFKQAPSNPFQQNTIADPFKQNTTSDLFKQAPNDPFKNANEGFTQNMFSSPFSQITQNQDSSKSIFGSTQSTIMQAPDRRQDDPTIYSKLEDLKEKEVKCFEAAVFEFGNIPVNPPPLQMC